MRRRAAVGCVVAGLFGLAALCVPARLIGDEPVEASADVPPALAPFAYLIGGWKGTGIPTANKVRGWPESHSWAWAFEKGRPVGLTAELTGNKLFKSLRLTHEPASKRYRLGATDAAGQAVTFAGTLEKGQLLLERQGPTAEGARQRVTIFPNSNQVRYTIWVAEQPKGAPQFSRTIEVGLTKAGESFAAGSGGGDLPKCVVTGGAATITVSYQGKSYALCCTGCRDEFNENPEKYVKKAALMLGSAPAASAPTPAPAPAPSAPAAEPKAKAAAKPAPASKGSTADPAARAATAIRLAQNLEKSGKTAAALGYYRQVVKDFPGTPAAALATARIKALEGR